MQGVGEISRDVRGQHVVQVAQTFQVHVHDCDIGPHARRDLGGIDPNHAAAENDDMGGGDSGDAS